MKSNDARFWMIGLTSALLLVLLFGFQNCAPVLPLDGVVDSSSLSVRATATPGRGAPVIGGAGYTGSSYDGVCITDPTSDAMAVNGSDPMNGANLVAFRNPDGRTAIWNVAGGNVAKGVVCKLTDYTLQAIGDFNGDTNPDLLWRKADGTAVLWLMRGTTRILTGFVSMSSPTSQIEDVADFNQDGRADIVWRDSVTKKITIWYMNGLNAKVDGAAFDLPAGASLMGVTDFDGDSKKELLSTTAGVLHLTTMTSPTTNSTADFAPGITSGYSVLSFGNFAGDIRSEFLLKSNSDSTSILRFMYGIVRDPTLPDSGRMAAYDVNWTYEFSQDLSGNGLVDQVLTLQASPSRYLGYLDGTVAHFFPTPVQSGFTVFKYPHY